LNPLRDANV